MIVRISNVGPLLSLRPSRSVKPFRHSRRSFLPGFASRPTTVTLRRTIPYPARSLYPIIADVDSYSRFLPFCLDSIVTERDERNYPIRADLKVGWNQWSEVFSSRVTCQPNIVSADASGHPLFEHLKATWTLIPDEERTTTVSLGVEYNFSNPIYNALAQQFVPHVTEELVKAFEDRAKQKIG